jgi:hypothetical protein
MKEFVNALFIGDVVGKPGLKAVEQYLPIFIEKYQPDIVIANGENAADGKGITDSEIEELKLYGVDVITTGNHVWDNWAGRKVLAKYTDLIRPMNYPQGNPGLGFTFHKIDDDIEVAVLNLQGRTFMQSIDCPFKAADYALSQIAERTKLIIVDFHADATAEKIAFSWYLDGRVSAVIGTHTHVQTNDHTILPKGTAHISDVGMTGPYDSVLGMKKEIAIRRFTLQTTFKFEMAEDDIRLCATFLKISTATGTTKTIETIMYPPPIRNL